MMNDHKDIWSDDLKNQKGGFKMPENYLSDFEDKMMNEISDSEKEKKSNIVQLKPILISVLSSAAILMLAYFLFFNTSSTLDSETQNIELNWDEYASFDESWIKEELASLEIEEESEFDPDIDYLLSQGVTNAEIIESYEFLP
jgi:hypothetical protein